ncbi:MAG TPA: ComEA family DNA-binding protein [Gemmatimonadales bacterium]|nr:ComEA family DNA-binding protein [Gemmatimonadales bacterium]
MNRGQWIGAGLLAALALGAGAWYSRSAPQPPPETVVRPHSSASITVHVSGRVRNPGLVAVPAGSRVADAIAAAGGALAEADLGALNLAAPLADGQHLVVSSAVSPEPGDGRVRVNTAGPAELEALPGVGPVLAARIVEYRERHGPFVLVEDLLGVPGIGEAKLAALRDSVLVP